MTLPRNTHRHGRYAQRERPEFHATGPGPADGKLLSKLFSIAVVIAIGTTALAQDSGTRPDATRSDQAFRMREREPTTGTSIPRVLITSDIPLDRPYHRLTEQQKALVRAKYVGMNPEDEPPFPIDGMGKLQNTIRVGAEKMQLAGTLYVILHVDSTGAATTARIMLAPTEEFGRFAASVGLLTRFKPAVCGGQPCAMDFPIGGEFSLFRR